MSARGRNNVYCIKACTWLSRVLARLPRELTRVFNKLTDTEEKSLAWAYTLEV
ncbi:hypothetical protein SCLCIDRAFT_1218431 [Scleroderma citrinum Foug A]|uniref:Uncharacterized protein n=1 Tax=Scleroderma citrinum Foug A TaxID=1036808 RepID=A0A0C3A240_9AGAM|nr:hypothetical protein SCLCIDRAFT_1218431 [Scleroderma citrinum Foug A]